MRRGHIYTVPAADAPARKALIQAVHGRSIMKPLMTGETDDGQVVFEHSGWSIDRALPPIPGTLPVPEAPVPPHVLKAIGEFHGYIKFKFSVMKSGHDLGVGAAVFEPELRPAELDAYHALFLQSTASREMLILDRAYYEPESNVLLMSGHEPDSDYPWVLTLNCTGGSMWDGSIDIDDGFTEGSTPRMQELFREWRDIKKQAIEAFPFLPPLSAKRPAEHGPDEDEPATKKQRLMDKDTH